MLRSTDTNDKRLRIMEAAAQVFSQKGFHRAKMEEIAQEANVGKGTIYEYFSGKQQLFIEMFKVGRKYYYDVMARELEDESELCDLLRKVAYLHLKFIHVHKDIAKIMMQEFLQLGIEMHNEIFQAHEQEVEILEKIIRKGVQNGTFRPLDIRLTAQIFYGSVHTMGVPMIINRENWDLESLSEKIVDIFLNGIKS